MGVLARIQRLHPEHGLRPGEKSLVPLRIKNPLVTIFAKLADGVIGRHGNSYVTIAQDSAVKDIKERLDLCALVNRSEGLER